jgi:chorismate dehydratase
MRVGQTYFKNTDFIYYAIEEGLIRTNGVGYLYAHPPKLGEMLVNREVEIAPVSSIIYGQRYGDFAILPDFSISAYGGTKSILVFSDSLDSLEDLEGKTLAVPGTSASSSALAEIILKNKGVKAEILHHEEPNLEAMLRKADAALLIGDDALVAYFRGSRVITDLGEEWKDATGKKMVYALWAIRREFADENPGIIREFYDALKRSREYAYKNIDSISRALAERIEISPELMREHLLTIDYGLDEEGEEGLREYFEHALKCGILQKRPEINYFQV